LGKEVGGRISAASGSFDHSLAEPRAQVLAALGQIVRSEDVAVQAKAFKAKGELLDRAVASAAAVVEHRAPLLPSWRRYTGVVWAHLAPSALPNQCRARILVPSGLYGITKGTDPVADYRLGMQGELGELGSLRSHWRDPITDLLVTRLKGRTVFNLLPAEHAQAIDLVRLAASAQLVSVRFVSADGRQAVGHHAKAAKGQLARVLLQGGLDAALHFSWDGWTTRLSANRLDVFAPNHAARPSDLSSEHP
jgi:hypothetical protein